MLSHDRRVTIEEIKKRVCEHFNIRLTDMSSARRNRQVARPRQVAMYLAKQLTQRSLPEIGRKFGNRDHTTVMHAVQRVGELMERDVAFAEDVELLRRMLEVLARDHRADRPGRSGWGDGGPAHCGGVAPAFSLHRAVARMAPNSRPPRRLSPGRRAGPKGSRR